MSPQVLMMSFEEGCRITDVAALQAAQLPVPDVARLLAEVFSEQMFCTGFLHCDPHPGNLLVRKSTAATATGGPGIELVLLDHGLYREIDDAFRVSYCRLWQALILGDAAAIKTESQLMHAGEMYATICL